MTKRVDRWQSDRGDIFATEHDAWRDDLAHWLEKNGAENPAIAKRIAAGLNRDNLTGLMTIATALDQTMPIPAAHYVDERFNDGNQA